HWILTILLVLSLGINLPLQAEWGRAADEYISLPLYRDAHICSDGNGGCWATGQGIGLSHVDRNGNLTWEMEPFHVQPRPGYNPRPVLADNGDVIVAMNVYNENNGLIDVYLQRINIDQEHVWSEAGIQLDTSSRYEGITGMYKGLVDDSYLIHWVRRDENYRNYDLRLQLINGDGDFLWGIGGIGLNWPYLYGFTSKIIISNDQCAIAVHTLWEDDEGDIEVHKIASDGERLWSESYTTLGGDIRLRLLRDAESDRSGGAIILYDYLKYESIDDSITYYGINAMRISGDGDSLWTRQVYEREKESEHDPFLQCESIINYADSGRFFVAWADDPRAFQVVALDVNGEFFWDEPVDVILNPANYEKLDAADSDGGVCYVWRDIAGDREDGGPVQQWGQRINIAGERLWGDRGRAIQARNCDQSSITTNGNGGVITVVEYNPTVQMINRNGEIGVVLENNVGDDNNKQKSSILSPQLFIYPNPGNTHFRIEYDTGIPNEIFSYGIYNLLGRTIKTGIMRGGNTMVNDLSPFSSGEYILRLQSPRTTVSTRFLLIK
ncbi:T9SS type A sorting domain-containing protein, partial [bacterium]|nr:T9SS type A sorting domain-containing protein [bacterium]